jgi:hypothetical protein
MRYMNVVYVRGDIYLGQIGILYVIGYFGFGVIGL